MVKLCSIDAVLDAETVTLRFGEGENERRIAELWFITLRERQAR